MEQSQRDDCVEIAAFTDLFGLRISRLWTKRSTAVNVSSNVKFGTIAGRNNIYSIYNLFYTFEALPVNPDKKSAMIRK